MSLTTVGRLLIDEALPAPLRGRGLVLDKKGIARLLGAVATEHPESYRAVGKALADLGRRAATETGGNSFALEHLRKAKAGRRHQARLRAAVDRLLDDDSLDDARRRDAIIRAAGAAMDAQMDEVLDESLAEDNPLALQVLSGARGNKMNLASLRGSDLLYTDHRDRAIPLPVLRSYSEGLTPAEYWAGTYGARRGVMATKFAVRDAGALAKQLNQVAHRLMVVADDDDEPAADAGPRGLPVDTDDLDNEGALLAHDVGPFRRNTVLTPRVLKTLRAQGHDRILVRSPLVGGSPEGGVYGRDVGVREKGVIPGRGEMVGLQAAQALCLDEDTEVRMADGSTRPIREVRPGDMVMGSSVSGVLQPVRVVAVYANGARHCHETVFRLGTGGSTSLLRVVSTLDHKLLSVLVPNKTRERRPDAEVRPIRRPGQPHDRFYAKLGTGFDDSGLRAEPMALLAGVLIGDGSFAGCASRVAFSCHDPALERDVSYAIAKFGLWLSPAATPGEFSVVQHDATRLLRCQGGKVVRNVAKRFLVEHGLWGKRSHEKTLPAGWRSWDNASLAALLGGLIATDGCVHRTERGRVSVSFCGNSRALVSEVREALMSRFGIYPSNLCASRKRNKAGEYYRDVYVISVNGHDNVSRFAAAVPIPGCKGPRLKAWLAAWPRSKKSAESGRCALVRQEAVGLRETYDIEVDHPDHLFVLANGLIVSNSEPLSQAQLSAKHSGGVAGQEKGLSGFAAIDQLIQVPAVFRGGAAHAQADGTVAAVTPAPAGGHNVTIAGRVHYVPDGFAPLVKPGDAVEAGDVLSEGTPNPAEVVRHKGIGEGRRYFTTALRDALGSAGIRANRRNVELIARGLINHVRLGDETDDGVPDDVRTYAALERSYTPRAGAVRVPPKRALGQHLERPVLHYTIGTRVRPSVVRELERFGVAEVHAHPDPPPFEPVMVRGTASIAHDPDFLTRMYGSGQKASLLDAARRGGESDEAGTSFVPGLARAVDFGRTGLVRAPAPGKKPEEPEEMPRKSPFALDLPAVRPAPAPPPASPQGWNLFKAARQAEQLREAQALLKAAAARMDQARPKTAATKPPAVPAPPRPEVPRPPQPPRPPEPPRPPRPPEPQAAPAPRYSIAAGAGPRRAPGTYRPLPGVVPAPAQAPRAGYEQASYRRAVTPPATQAQQAPPTTTESLLSLPGRGFRAAAGYAARRLGAATAGSALQRLTGRYVPVLGNFRDLQAVRSQLTPAALLRNSAIGDVIAGTPQALGNVYAEATGHSPFSAETRAQRYARIARERTGQVDALLGQNPVEQAVTVAAHPADTAINLDTAYRATQSQAAEAAANRALVEGRSRGQVRQNQQDQLDVLENRLALGFPLTDQQRADYEVWSARRRAGWPGM